MVIKVELATEEYGKVDRRKSEYYEEYVLLPIEKYNYYKKLAEEIEDKKISEKFSAQIIDGYLRKIMRDQEKILRTTEKSGRRIELIGSTLLKSQALTATVSVATIISLFALFSAFHTVFG